MAKNSDKNKTNRIAIITPELCKPDKCAYECRRHCPVNRIGKVCVEVKAVSAIEESLCIGCGHCVKKCPFNAIVIVNLPSELSKDCSHRYGANSFKLHRLPVPRPGKVLGLVGTNGIGKSTALNILSGKIKPNFGSFESPPEWAEILRSYRGSELQGYFTRLIEKNLTTSTKMQYVDKIPAILEKKFGRKDVTVDEMLENYDARGMREHYSRKFEIGKLGSRRLRDLSGGERQRFALAVTCMQKADVYVFDEPTSFLDVRQRLTAAREIRRLAEEDGKYVIVVEHDLAILDLMCDFGCVLYGQAGVYGVISAPFSIKNAINIFLDGFIPTENMRFRASALKFNIQDLDELRKVNKQQFQYNSCIKTYQSENGSTFRLVVEAGHFSNSEIVVLLGENGMGKSTLVGLLSGAIGPDGEGNGLGVTSSVSVKPQKIMPKFRGTVSDLFTKKLKGKQHDATFCNEVIKPLKIDYLMESQVESLSGGELQRVAIVICLGKEADLYLIDEPAAFLDSDQRIAVSKVIKKFVYSRNRAAFIVEHDLIVGTYLADRVVVFDGKPGKEATASASMDVKDGMNVFLKQLDVTFRRDPTNFRPRVNKPDSAKDRDQKESNNYYYA